MIKEISHITFIVQDLEITAHFLESVFDAQLLYSSDDKTFSLSREKYFLIGETWVCIMEGAVFQERTYNHIAFQIPEEEYENYLNLIESLGLSILPGRVRVEGEGKSIYFYDYDNHLFELHTGTLEKRLERYNK